MVPAILAACIASLLSSQPVAGQSSADVSGRVVDAMSHAPIAGVEVTLVPTMYPAAATNLLAVTDANGAFAFHRLVPGRYRPQTRKDGFAALAGPFDDRTLDVEPGQSRAGVELEIRPAATLSGRIVDAGGRPASGLTVSALRRATASIAAIASPKSRRFSTSKVRRASIAAMLVKCFARICFSGSASDLSARDREHAVRRDPDGSSDLRRRLRRAGADRAGRVVRPCDKGALVDPIEALRCE